VIAAETCDVMSAEAAEVVTSPFHDNVTSATSVFERYSWVGLLSVHGPTALQVRALLHVSSTYYNGVFNQRNARNVLNARSKVRKKLRNERS